MSPTTGRQSWLQRGCDAPPRSRERAFTPVDRCAPRVEVRSIDVRTRRGDARTTRPAATPNLGLQRGFADGASPRSSSGLVPGPVRHGRGGGARAPVRCGPEALDNRDGARRRSSACGRAWSGSRTAGSCYVDHPRGSWVTRRRAHRGARDVRATAMRYVTPHGCRVAHRNPGLHRPTSFAAPLAAHPPPATAIGRSHDAHGPGARPRAAGAAGHLAPQRS